MESDDQRIRREYRELKEKARQQYNKSLVDSGYPRLAKKTIMVPKTIRVCARCGSERVKAYKGIEQAYKCCKCGQWHTLDLD